MLEWKGYCMVVKKLNKPKIVVPEGIKNSGFRIVNYKNNSNSFNSYDSFSAAIQLLNKGDLNGGKDLLNKILKFDPGHKNSIKVLSNLFLEANKSELAIKLVFDYLKNNNDDSEFMNLMGVYLNSIGETKLAALFYKKSLLFSKDNEIILKNLEIAENAYIKKRYKKISSKYLYLLKLVENCKILKPSVALCMIVKNKEENLYRCLNSVKDIFKEIVIVDTGSTDKTIEIARSFGAEVRNFELVGDFLKARNESIKDVKSDWIFYMDADEYMDSSGQTFFDNLENFDKPIGFFVKIICFLNGTNCNNAENISVRLFNNRKGFKFNDNNPEQLELNGGKETYERVLSSLVLGRTGNREDEINIKDKIFNILPEKILQDDREKSINFYNMGINAYKNQEYSESIKYFGLAIDKLNPSIKTLEPFCYSYISSAYCSLGKGNEAVQFAKKAIKSQANFKDGYYCLASAQFLLNDNENALANFKKTLELKDEIFAGGTIDSGIGNWKSLNGIGAAYLAIEDYENALKYLKEAYKIENKSAMVILNLLAAHKKNGSLSDFLKIFKNIKGIEFSVGETQQMVNIFLLSKDFDKAFTVLNEVLDFYNKKNIKKDRKGIEISILKENLAEIYFAKIDYVNAVMHYEDFFKTSEGSYDSCKNTGVCYFYQGDYSKAEHYFEKACKYGIKSLNNDWDIYHKMGMLKMKLGKFDESLVYFKKSMTLNPDNSETYINLGKIYLLNKDYENANIVFESDPVFMSVDSNPEILIYNSEALYFLEKYDDALNNLFLYLEKVKEDEETYNRIGLCFSKLKEYKEATRFFSKAIDINNQSPDYFCNLGNCLVEAKNIKDARLAYECALILDNNHIPSIAGLQILDINYQKIV